MHVFIQYKYMITPELLDFLRAQLTRGMEREALERILTTKGGWSKDDINEGFLALEKPLEPIAPVSVQAPKTPLPVEGTFTPGTVAMASRASSVETPITPLPIDVTSPVQLEPRVIEPPITPLP
jgi:hypothetical protein